MVVLVVDDVGIGCGVAERLVVVRIVVPSVVVVVDVVGGGELVVAHLVTGVWSLLLPLYFWV